VSTTDKSGPPSPPAPSAPPNPIMESSDAVLQASPEFRNSFSGDMCLPSSKEQQRQSLPFLSDGFYEKTMFRVIDSIDEDANVQMSSWNDQLRRIEERVYGTSQDSVRVSLPASNRRASPRIDMFPPPAAIRRTSPSARVTRDEQRVQQEDLKMSRRALVLSPAFDEVDDVLQLMSSYNC